MIAIVQSFDRFKERSNLFVELTRRMKQIEQLSMLLSLSPLVSALFASDRD